MNVSLSTLLFPLAFILLLILGLLLIRAVRIALRPEPNEVSCSWKFRTVVYLALSLLVPLWPVTFPVFLLLAHRSYLAGAPNGRGAA